MTIQQTNITPPRADFRVEDFNNLIYQKGRRVWFEKGVRCPCKSLSTNSNSSCKNCGGLGYVYINGKETRMVVTGVAVTNDVKSWSEEARGTVNISCSNREQLTHMDRITLLDANSIHSEVIHLRKKTATSQYYGWSVYPVKKLLYASMFIDTDTPLQLLQSSDLEFGPKNQIKLSNTVDLSNITDDEDISMSIRYYFATCYYVLEMRRETMQSFRYEDSVEGIQDMPLSAIGRRAHMEFDSPTLSGTMLLSNNYTEIVCDESQLGDICDCNSSITIIIPPTINNTIRQTFISQNSIVVSHGFGREPNIVVYNEDGEQFKCDVTVLTVNSVRVTFDAQMSGTIIIQ